MKMQAFYVLFIEIFSFLCAWCRIVTQARQDARNQFTPMSQKRKFNPKSLENLTHEGRPQAYDEAKQGHRVTVTPTGWEGFRSIAEQLDISVSELIERFGRGQLIAASSDVSASNLMECLGSGQIIILRAKPSTDI